MLYGLLENAIGWHIAERDRNEIIKQLQKEHGKAARESGIGYKSLLQFHLRFGLSQMPQVMHYDDYWSQHLSGPSFVGGSREYDARAIPLMNAIAGKKVTVNDRAEAKKEPELLTPFQPDPAHPQGLPRRGRGRVAMSEASSKSIGKPTGGPSGEAVEVVPGYHLFRAAMDANLG